MSKFKSYLEDVQFERVVLEAVGEIDVVPTQKPGVVDLKFRERELKSIPVQIDQDEEGNTFMLLDDKFMNQLATFLLPIVGQGDQEKAVPDSIADILGRSMNKQLKVDPQAKEIRLTTGTNPTIDFGKFIR